VVKVSLAKHCCPYCGRKRWLADVGDGHGRKAGNWAYGMRFCEYCRVWVTPVKAEAERAA